MRKQDGFLTIDEAAQVSGVTHWTIRRWLKTGRLTRYVSGFRPFVCCDELLTLVNTKTVQQA
jgi:excisionase family DNA binding protein